MAINKVRIAVSINEFGQWAAYGRWDMRDDVNMEEANGNVSHDGPLACYFVEVEIPVPTHQQIQGILVNKLPEVLPPKKESMEVLSGILPSNQFAPGGS